MAARIITLTTDFGTADGFPAAMKGVILGITPDARVVDLTHEIGSQDVAQASFALYSALRFWTAPAIHVAVVDPGVGTDRKALIVEAPGDRILIGPDNGIFSHLLAHGRTTPGSSYEMGFLSPYRGPPPEGVRAYAVQAASFMREKVSQTFHGRDVFAPAAARIAVGERPSAAGPSLNEITYLNLPGAKREGQRLAGHVQHVDRFGNLITDISISDFPGGQPSSHLERVTIAGRTITNLNASYSEARGLGCVIGSLDFLEIFQTGGSAARTLSATVGTPVRVHLRAN
ncbi:MAG: SAM-dependent chlorinase/fluorinase [Chloroflexi bacterium]|nr:SAM-dependent chlorinase/fluorinase [Chloroflexota bacterium]